MLSRGPSPAFVVHSPNPDRSESQKYGRKVVLAGRSLLANVKIANESFSKDSDGIPVKPQTPETGRDRVTL